MSQDPKAIAPSSPQDGRWTSTVGDEIKGLLQRSLPDDEARIGVLQTSMSILGRGISPAQKEGKATGLVVGYVQSGKTLSFTSVIALARDNGFRFVIVITGISNPLLKQTAIDRLPKDLQIGDSDGPPQWIHLNEPGKDCAQDIKQLIDKWRNTSIHNAEKPTLLITVKKQYQRLNSIRELLSKFDLRELPTLIIDDEADQASLNTMIKKKRESRTYTCIMALRKTIPHLTYLQYTATPQALLLINIIDNLSPSFVKVLEPGNGYVGGREFFVDSDELTPEIPPADLPTQPLEDPPPSLLIAMRQFFIGVAVGLMQGWNKKNPNRSMFVHPSRETEKHFQYFSAIEKVRDNWSRLITLAPTDSDRRELIDDFKIEYDELATTFDKMPLFSDIVNLLPRALSDTYVREINTRGGRKTPPVEWGNTYPWILVGGQSMDRGFTIKGLTVTYMPRTIGTGNADTLQQRARFFGYKRSYLGLCRLHLEGDVLEAFQSYVEHEEEMRNELIKLSTSNQPLIEWKRRFILSRDLKPCRSNVIEHGITRGNYANKWGLFPDEILMSDEAIQNNKAALHRFLSNKTFIQDTSYQSDRSAQQHKVCAAVPLRDLLSDCLTQYQVAGVKDSPKFVGLQLHLLKALEANTNEVASVYLMRPEYTSSRTVPEDRSIDYFMQGRTETAAGKITYPGDESFRASDNVTVQIHFSDLKDRRGNVFAKSVPLLAIRIPQRLGLSWVAQGQPGQRGT